MKNKYHRRFPYDLVKPKDLRLTYLVDSETDLKIMTNKALDKDFFKERIQQYRWDIESYIIKDRRFLTAFSPIAVELSAPQIVQKMSHAAKCADVGPMTTVAGAIAEFLGRDLLKKGYREVVIQNRTDIFLASRKSRIVNIYHGKMKLWQGLGIKVAADMMPVGVRVCGAKIDPSLSFGCADSVAVLSKNLALADAVAAHAYAKIHSKKDLTPVLNSIRSVKGICGAAIILKDDVVSWGKIELVTG